MREELEAAADAQGRSFAGTAREWGDADWEKARGVAKSKNAEDKAKR